MIEEFLSKLNNNEYISNYLYEYVLNNNSSIIPTGFNIDEYNGKILDKLYVDNKDYFDNMYKGIDDNIHLDEEQCKAILADEKYSLIIAGAGTGKTTTMSAKVKYLVDKKNALPERILVMSYTRKATEELIKRIEADFDIPAHIKTFHSLGFEYIRLIFKGRHCDKVDRNKKDEILLKYFSKLFTEKNKIEEILVNFESIKRQKHKFIFSNFFIENYKNYETYDDFLNALVDKKMNEAKTIGFEKIVNDRIKDELLKEENQQSLKGEYVKSSGELLVANYLFFHGLDYNYEEAYDELMDNNSIYKPDFTIDYGGEKIYIEYFGLDDEDYIKIKEKKELMHKEKGNKFISLDKVPLSKIAETLNKEFERLNVQFHNRTYEEIYEHVLRMNPFSQVYPFLDYLYEGLLSRKESAQRDDDVAMYEYLNSLEDEERKTIEIQYKYLKEFYSFYNKECFGGDTYYFEYSDLLYYAVKYLETLTTDKSLLFDYIIIDEYQDISKIKYELTKKTAERNDAKVYAVGDDWQSIYAFSGSRIEYIYKFNQYFKGAKNFNITKTYRNSQELINYSGEFIMKNDDQLKKQLVSDKHIDKPIVMKCFNSEFGPFEEQDCLKQTILEIHKENPDHNILVLGRTNKMINNMIGDGVLEDGIGTKIRYYGHADIDIDGMTMHKSKGLTFDEVIVIGLNKSFPSIKYDISWFDLVYKNKPVEEAIPFAEERRLFYVALTRTKNRVYLLRDDNPKGRSEFISEIESIINNKE